MGKVKIETKKLEEETNRRSTFTKRGSGVLKKACELSILCDTDVAIIAFSPTGELLYYCNTSVADVMKRFADVDPNRRTEILERQIARLESQCKISLKDHPQRSRPENDELLQESLLRVTGDEDRINPLAPKRARAAAAAGVRFAPQPEVQQVTELQPLPPPQQPVGPGSCVTCGSAAASVRFLPQAEIQHVAQLQPAPPSQTPIEVALGTTSGQNNCLDPMCMNSKASASQYHHTSFQYSVQAAYDNARFLNQSLQQMQHDHHQSTDYKQGIREDQGFGGNLWAPFPACSNTNLAQGTFESIDGQHPLF